MLSTSKIYEDLRTSLGDKAARTIAECLADVANDAQPGTILRDLDEPPTALSEPPQPQSPPGVAEPPSARVQEPAAPDAVSSPPGEDVNSRA